MGTTGTALRTGSGRYGFALLIEGYDRILTDSADTAAVVAAYAGSGWTQALAGLKVVGGVTQEIEPFKEGLDVPELTFQIQDVDGSDTFGSAIWKTKPSISSRLDDLFEPATDGSGTLRVRSNTGFATSGVGYLGAKRVEYSGKSGSTDFTIGAGGANTLAPFSADGSNHFSWPNRPPTGGFFDRAAPPVFSDVPKTWHGKRVALYLHRIVGGIWDTRAQAHLEFAGRLVKVTEGTSNETTGTTFLHCRDLRQDVVDAQLLRSQWVGYVKEGIRLAAGDKFQATEMTLPGGKTVSDEFTVVASGASGTDEIDEGTYEYDEFLRRLTAWLAADPSLNANWKVTRELTEEGYRTIIRADFGDSDGHMITLGANRFRLLDFMGFSDVPRFDAIPAGVGGGVEFLSVQSPPNEAFALIASTACPYRTRALQAVRPGQQYEPNLELIDGATTGTWFEHGDFAPPSLSSLGAGTNPSYIRIGEKQLAVAHYDSATLLTSVIGLVGFGQPYEEAGLFDPPGITFDDDAENLPVYQVVCLNGKFSEIIPRLFASIGGTAGVNHADYDAFPWGAAIPWSLLGDDFVASCQSLEQANPTDTITVMLDRPTPLGDVLLPEMSLRFAFLIFKDGGYRFVSPPVPNSITAEHAFTEANKAVPGGNVPPARSEWSSEMLINVIKIRQGRAVGGEYKGPPVEVRDQASIDVHGETKPWTIDAVNAVAERSNLSEAVVNHLASQLSARLLPMFGKPLKVVSRPIAPSMFHVCPGDTGSLTDLLVRDPATGTRGVDGRACIVLSSFHDYGHEDGEIVGEVKLLVTDEDRTYPLSPAAEIDTSYTSGLYTSGYDSTNFRIALKANSFSRAASDEDDVTHFDAGDKVRIVEIDPAAPASPDAWDRTVASVSAGSPQYLQLTAALSSPAWSGATKKFAVIAQGYAAVQASQKLHTFQADDGDGMIVDTVEPNLYGASNAEVFAAGASTDLPALLAHELYGDGKPLTPLQLQYLARGHNNLLQRKTAPHKPFAISGFSAIDQTDYELLLVLPFYIGGQSSSGRLRKLLIAPQVKTDNAARTVSIRVSSARFPPGGQSTSAFKWPGLALPRSVTFTTTNTTAEIPTAQELQPVPAELPGHTWLIVEGKISSAGSGTLYGFPTLYLQAGA